MVQQNKKFSSPREYNMATHDQPVKKKQRIDLDHGPDISDASPPDKDETDCMSIRTVDVQSGARYAENRELYLFQINLTKQCLCFVTEKTLRKPFEGHYTLDENGTVQNTILSKWPTTNILQFLSNVQLLFDVYLKQNTKGVICARVMDLCDAIIRNEHNLIEEVINLGDIDNKYVSFLASRVLSSFLIIAKDNMDVQWLQKIVEALFMFERLDFLAVRKIIFSLEIIKRVVEWKDIDQHPLDDSAYDNNVEEDINQPSTSSNYENSMQVDRISPICCNNVIPEEDPINVPSIEMTNCHSVELKDSESFDTTHIKCLAIKTLENKWPDLVNNIRSLLIQHMDIKNAENCVLTFLSLWENIISVKANLSVIETRPFYAHLENFVVILNPSLSSIVYKQLLSLFNEVLCYGSTLALQDMLPEETCSLAHLIVRYVKDFRILDGLPLKLVENSVGFVGYQGIPRTYINGSLTTTELPDINDPEPINTIDRTLLQKMVLLVLKSVAVTVKETRSDTSDSSIDSADFDVFQDMQLIERSIRDVLKKLEVFIKNTLDFHPESSFSKILVHLFNDQDDYLIEAMVCTLDTTVGILYRNAVFPDLATMLNPVSFFIEFLNIVSHDPDILLDYLVNNETCFLLYLLRFLKYVRRNWSKFVMTCHEHNNQNGLDETMSVLIRLRLQIARLVSRSLFPYNISPVLRLLEVCESLYEGNEIS
ncbi:protein lines isoform X1 [Ctenocephalides felis]|uniref:protein lines isoform X1 n=1 Tax=Ctenocephalides felis TaxID=7515 RepID=UPI000E6E4064|nr:protein lines isoform X1 [Ctenocephalides felis]